MQRNILLIFTIFLVLTSCFLLDIQLTDELVQSYIAAYTKLRNLGPNLVSADGQILFSQDEEDFKEIENIILESGFSSFQEFMSVNVKIGSTMSIVESRIYMDKMDDLTDVNSGQWAELEAMLNDPDVPAETKEEIRRTFEESRQNYEENLEYAQPILDFVSGFSDQNAVELVTKYHDQIIEAYTGIQQ
jgi:hypothetical protein